MAALTERASPLKGISRSFHLKTNTHCSMRRHEDTTRPTLLKCRRRAECNALCSLPSENNSLIGKWAVKLKHSFESRVQGSHAPHTVGAKKENLRTKGGSNDQCVPDRGFPSMPSKGRAHSPRRARCPVAQSAPSPVVEVARRGSSTRYLLNMSFLSISVRVVSHTKSANERREAPGSRLPSVLKKETRLASLLPASEISPRSGSLEER